MKKRLIKPKLRNQTHTAFRVKRNASIKRNIDRGTKFRESENRQEKQENPNSYAVDNIEKSADATIMNGFTYAKKTLHYAYRNHKTNKYTSSSSPNGQDVSRLSNPFGSATDKKSTIKTKENYIREFEEKRANISRFNMLKENQSEEVKSVRHNTVKNKIVQIDKRQKNPTHNMVKKYLKQFRQKAQIKMRREPAKHSLQATKLATRISVKLTQLTIAAVKALGASIIAFGGGVMLFVVLLIIIVVAAVAASPFGIFISEEANDGIPISAVVAECNQELTERIEEIERAHTFDREEVQGEQADWPQVLAVFSVKTAGTNDDTAQDVVVIDENKKRILKGVFWDMNPVSSTVTQENGEIVLYITIGGKTSDEMIVQYRFSKKQREALTALLKDSAILISTAHSLTITDAKVKDVLNNLPQDLSPERRAVVKTACSLVGKVNYFWGGKSSAMGWESRWGKIKRVTADGSSTTGTMRPFGLDCSGFVSWTFLNANAGVIGDGTQGQLANSARINWSSAQPGDLAFYDDLSHVGIIVGKDSDGNILVVHCNSSANNVSLTINSGFGFCARPSIY